MSSAVVSPVARHRRIDVEALRAPGERMAFVACAVSNAVVVALAIAIVFAGTSWLTAHPGVGKHLDTIRAVLVTAIVALPGTAIGRQVSYAATETGGVRVDENQFAALHVAFVRACRELGFDRIPDLYLSREVAGTAAAHTLWSGRSIVVIDAELVDDDWAEGLDWLTFLAARQLGAIRLGHTRWWVELLTVYARRIPGLRVPLHVAWTRSRDRCAAFVVPDGIRGLVVEAVGNHALRSVDVPSFVRQTERAPGVWDHLANVVRQRPSLVARARALYEEGFFDRARDVSAERAARPSSSPPPPEPSAPRSPRRS